MEQPGEGSLLSYAPTIGRPTAPGTSRGEAQTEDGRIQQAVGDGRADSAAEDESVRSSRVEAAPDQGNELMLALQRGERQALQRLFALYNGKLYNYIHRIIGDAESAEDIVQETWLSLYERRSGYQPIHRFSTWLFTIARRKALSEIRRRKVRAVVRSLTAMADRRSGEEFEAPQKTFTAPDAHTDGRILAAVVERALERISSAQREIILLRDVEGFENEEIAEILGWNAKPGAIRKRVFDAREAFRRAMTDLGYQEK
jgi:RNA polymerase sigma-70 factor (ECF subfamily)